MSNISHDLIDDVSPGDIVAVDRTSGAQSAKVVHKEPLRNGAAYLVTFEAADAETFELEFPAGARVTRSLEAKWESAQSPTPHKPPTA